MPVILPTSEEMTRMGWREREIARANVRRALAALARVEQRDVDDLEVVYQQAVAKVDEAAEWGRAVRAEARRLQAQTAPDPDADQHRAALLEALDA